MEVQFLNDVERIIGENMGNEDFSVSFLAKEVGLSRSMLHRKLIRLTGKSATQLITELRLSRARELIENKVATMSEIAYMVGFKSPSYFNKVFKNIYHFTPGEVRDKGKGKRISILNSARNKRKIWIITSVFGFTMIVILTALIILLANYQKKGTDIMDNSIAVLLFQNFSGDPDQDFMCFGLTDEIINHLYNIKSFDKVVSLTSVLTYKDLDKTILHIADELQVNYVLEGTYKRDGTDIRITAQLIDAKNDKLIWQESYDELYSEIITIQADIALKIAEQLKTIISSAERTRIESIPTRNQEAYELIQKFKYSNYYATGNVQDIKFQTDQLLYAHQAIELDPYYADAYAYAGSFILGKGVWSGDIDIQTAALKAIPYFEKALSLDAHNVQAQTGIALINHLVRWNFIKAEDNYLSVIHEMPNNPQALAAYVLFLIQMDRCMEVIPLLKDSDYSLFEFRIKALVQVGHYQEAKKQVQNWLNVVGNPIHSVVGELYIWLGEIDSAGFYLESALQACDSMMLTPRFQANLAFAYHQQEKMVRSDTIISHLIKYSEISTAGSPNYFIAWYFSRLGESDLAFRWLEKAYNERSPELPWLKVDPAFDGLKEDKRYWDLYERTGHKAYDTYMDSK